MPGTAPSASSSGPTAAEDLPQLFVNQMVSSSVHWRELGVEVRQEAEMYSPGTAATARLTIAIHPPEGSANGDKPQAQFVLNWRVPGCAVACCFYVPGRMGAVTAPAFVCCHHVAHMCQPTTLTVPANHAAFWSCPAAAGGPRAMR